MQPYHTEVGAGTSNPATLLRVLGPRPWRVAYVEPSIRPDDGRYGENPYRFQQHYQYQVILKPAPVDVQDVYLRSLAAIGIDPLEHDIRFVEDNWESPSLGAWGLGWEVWMDGMEITQFTYFQQAGGIELEPVSLELTYGLERIAMHLQKVRRAHDLAWSDDVSWADVYLDERAPVLGLQLRAGRHRDAGPPLRRPRGRGRPLPGGGAAAARLRPGAEVLARLQPARLAAGDRGHRPPGLHPAHAPAVAGRLATPTSSSSRRPMPDLLDRDRLRGAARCGLPHRPRRSCRRPSRARSTAAGLPAERVRVHVAPRRLAVDRRGCRRRARRRGASMRGPRADAPEQARAGFARKHGLEPGALDERDGFLWAVIEARRDAGGRAGAAGGERPGRPASSSQRRCAGPAAAASRGRSAGWW